MNHLNHFDARISGTPALVIKAFEGLWDAEGIADVTVELPGSSVLSPIGCVLIDSADGSRITVSTVSVGSSITAANRLRKMCSLAPLGWAREARHGYSVRVLTTA